ncbi:chemotaxis protein CheX [Undibacterium sp. Jales W-56]|uniref:chemotaxis protein CheX n=1 Tax=Undibacterium sp. Jales W-56 TaxID=2897325 RepID=UPI0021D2A544|nr:chemotaxis protein CheX [Undibacterium sp. Jales W-56]MCU6435503.1 chemotaxis protein CheX [Undibacterium sp. Jales W-56]
MDSLTDIHLDALSEVFNIGAGRAAASLSEIVGDEVKLSVPKVEVRKTSELNASMLALDSNRFGAVMQQFTGPFNAEAVLLFSEDHALEIVRDMMSSQMSIEELAEFEQEAMCELGNIILNACLSAVADMLDISFNSSLPSYSLASADELFKRIGQNADHPYILILHIDLAIERRHSKGHLIFLLSSASLSNLVHQIDRFLGNI